MIGSFARSIRQRLGKQSSPELYYIAPGVNWILDWIGTYITGEVERQFGLKAHAVNTASGLSNQILHYASLWEMAGYVHTKLSERNANVGTIFHGLKDAPLFQEAINTVLANEKKFAKVHTASKIMEERLIAWGIPAQKLVRIPLGVDLKWFRPAGFEKKAERRKELGIPEDAICIGSFHKDGVGREEGNEPKLIKGPDVLLKVIEKVHKAHPVFVLLSAPARGYVKAGLERAGVPYRHIVLDDYLQIPRLYQALDIYLMTSREEGGPNGVLEAMATGIPVVATRVGMVPDLIDSGVNGLVVESEDVDGLVACVTQLIAQPKLRKQLLKQGLQTIQDYDWVQIAARYYHEIYRPILDEITP